VLTDHKLLGMCLLPGTTYLEIVRAVAEHGLKLPRVELRDVFFLAPCFVERFASRQLFTHVRKGTSSCEWTISDSADDRAGMIFAKGAMSELTDKPQTPSAADGSLDPTLAADIAFAPVSGLFEFGPHWDTIRAFSRSESEATVDLSLRDEIKGEAAQFGLHPSLLDTAVNVLIQSYGGKDSTYLPYAYASLKCFRALSSRIRAHLRIRGSGEPRPEAVTFDILITDATGETCAEIRDYSIKRVPSAELDRMARSLGEHYTVHHRETVAPGQVESLSGQTVLVIAPQARLAEGIVQGLSQAGVKVVRVSLGETFARSADGQYSVGARAADYQELGAALANQHISQIIHCGGIGNGTLETLDSFRELCNRRAQSIESLFHLVRSLVHHKIEVPSGLTLVADCAAEVTGSEPYLNPVGHAFLSMARVLSQEYGASLPCRAMDIDADTPVETIIRELASTGRALRTGLRAGRVYEEEVARLRLDDGPTTREAAPVVRKRGVYLITGGLGGLGLQVARHLATRQPDVRLVLVGRSLMPPREVWATVKDPKLRARIEQIEDLERAGAQVLCESVDVADPEAVVAMLSRVRAAVGPINGIVHAAGLAGERFLIRKEEAAFMGVLAPKICGAWILERATREDPLDFLVMFSSMLSFLGEGGQADYTPANAFLDGFAHWLRRRGRNAISVNWSAWKEVGMAVAHDAAGDTELFLPVTTAQALRSFDQILATRPVNVVPARLNRKVASTEDAGRVRIAAELVRDAVVAAEPKGKGAAPRSRKESACLIRGKDDSALTDAERRVAAIFGGVLSAESIDVHSNFQELGGNSILAVQLLKELNQEFRIKIDIADVFSHASVVQMAAFVAGKLEASAKTSPKPSKPAPLAGDKQLQAVVDGILDDSISIDKALSDL
jgi:polyketide synthase PksN